MSQSTGSRFLDLVERSIIVQGIATLAILGLDIYLWATSQEVPDAAIALTWALLGVFLGGKIENAKARRAFPSNSGSQPYA